jgi:hypothetical protein
MAHLARLLLHSALRLLAEGIPRVRLNLSIPEELRITDVARANAVLRCVQEITTNSLKHSDAANLWIALRLNSGPVRIPNDEAGKTNRCVQSVLQVLNQFSGSDHAALCLAQTVASFERAGLTRLKAMTTQLMHSGPDELEVQRRDICAQHASQAPQ